MSQNSFKFGFNAKLSIFLTLTGASLTGVAALGAGMPWDHLENRCATRSDPNSATCAAHQQESMEGGYQLRRRITHRKLQRELCESPQSFCSAVRKMSPEALFKDFTSPSCQLSPFARNLSLYSFSTDVSRTADDFEQILKSAEFLPPKAKEGQLSLDELFRETQEQVAQHLASQTPPAPAAVVARARELKLVTARNLEAETPEIQEAYRSVCGLPTQDGSEKDGTEEAALPFMNFNAFHLLGKIYVCPQMEMNWIQGDLEGAAFTLAHEVAHAVSPDTLGAEAATWADRSEGCALKRADLEAAEIEVVDYLQRFKPVHECLTTEDAFIKGRSTQKLSRISERIIQHSDADLIDVMIDCSLSKVQLQRSSEWGKGLVANDTSKIGALLSLVLNMHSSRLKPARVLDATQLILMTFLPHEDQFSEAYADAVGIKVAPKLIENWRKKDAGRTSNLSEQERQFSLVRSLSFLCGYTEEKEKARDVHPIDFRRVDLIMTSPKMRELAGCEKISPERKPSPREARIHQCMQGI
jgi:hypothetical protein